MDDASRNEPEPQPGTPTSGTTEEVARYFARGSNIRGDMATGEWVGLAYRAGDR